MGEGTEVALDEGLAFGDGRGELVWGFGLLGVAVGAYADGAVVVAGLVLVPAGAELVGAGSGLTQR